MNTDQPALPQAKTSFAPTGAPSRLVIALDDIVSNNPPVYIGERCRRSSATSVVLLDPNTLACCQFDGRCMYLIKFDLDSGQSRVVAKADTMSGGQKCETDLMASDGHGHLITTNFFLHTCSLYRIEQDQIRFVRDLNYSAGDRVHGVKFLNSNIAAVTSRGQSAGAHFFDLETLNRILLMSTSGEGTQDLCFISNDRLALITTLGHPNLRPFEIYSSRIYLIKFDLEARQIETLARKEFTTTHFDNIVCYEGRLYITDQYNNKVVVLDADDLSEYDGGLGYDFPHGIDVNFGIVAVSNYGNNTISLQRL